MKKKGNYLLIDLLKLLIEIIVHTLTVTLEIFVVKKFSYSSKITQIKHTKYFQRAYYVIERELNYRRLRKFFNTNILHTNGFNTKIFQPTDIRYAGNDHENLES